MGVAAGTRRMDKIAGLTALLLQMRAWEGYGRPAQQSARLRGEPMKPYGGYRGFTGGASLVCLPPFRRPPKATMAAPPPLTSLPPRPPEAAAAPPPGAPGPH